MELLTKSEEQVKDYLKGLSDSEVLNYHREYCEANSYSDDEVYYNDEEFFEIYFSDVMAAIRAISYGDYTFTDEFVKFDGQANLETTNDIWDFVDIDELLNDAMENPERYDIEFEELDFMEMDDVELMEYLIKENIIPYTSSMEDYDREQMNDILIDYDLI